MDHGAHFYCCDFQVHTPRDHNWVGDNPVTLGDRQTFSREFIAACRAKGLDAVAITDHHDVAFVPLIRRAAQGELDASGNPVPAEKRIVLFPGIELTLGLPCQALLLFDPDAGDDDLHRALAALGITPAPLDSPKANPVQRLGINDLNEVYRRLSEHPSIRGRFILLPNVNDGGDDTILRPGFFEHYKKMLSVGGYVDGSFAGHGRRQILEGNDPQWGNKRIGTIQTSDARERDFSQLGAHPTWIKWSVPSTEAVRQACLAPGSRIRYTSPLLPDNWVSTIEVSDSKYFGPFSVEFNPQLNTIIGGRGSGKSTILEYLRWCLCDQPYVHHDENGTELPDYEKRRRSLVTSTLRPSQGTVAIHYVRHGVIHAIRRDGGTGKIYLRVGDRGEQETTEEVIQSLAQIQGYSQKQLSHVSVRTQELVRLLTTPIAQELSNADAEVATEASNLRQAFERVEARRALQAQLQALEVDLASKKEQVKALAEEVRDLPPEQRKDIDVHPLYVSGERLAESYKSALDAASTAITSTKSVLDRLPSELPAVGTGIPSAELETIRQRVAGRLGEAARQIEAIRQALDILREELRPLFERVAEEVSSHRQRYRAAASENLVIQERLNSLRELSDQIAATERERDTLLGRLQEVGEPDETLRTSRESWIGSVRRKAGLLELQATRLTTYSRGELRVHIQRGRGVEQLKTALQQAVVGASITRSDKFERLFQHVADRPDPLLAWLGIGQELLELACVGPRLATGAELPACPQLTAAGFIGSELQRIAARLSTTSAFQLTLSYPEDVPVFEYQTADGQLVPFQEASPGQQATALIGLLLNQSAGPLIVDQPEDDMDNSTILNVAERLWNAKEKRQIIFSTHNPNLVVIGDSELVLFSDYRQPLQSARIHVANQGAIDSKQICEVVTRVIEGGAEAFRLRKEKYGF
jgi:type III restriction enzyme